jgi:transcriptional regulator with XRE-family HTH domain
MLGYEGAMVSAFENGRRRLKLEDLARVCVALNKSPDFFLETDALRRTQQRRPLGLTLRAELAPMPDKTLTASISSFLDEIQNEVPSRANLPDADGLAPEEAAQQVLEHCGISDPPVEMEAVCDRLNIESIPWRFPDALWALIVEVAENEYVIGINSSHSKRRRRFSAAHEIGHAVLGHEASYYLELSAEDAWESPYSQYVTEREANQFAAALLMPRRWVKRDYQHGLRGTRELADRYDVSETAMGIRLLNLRLT